MKNAIDTLTGLWQLDIDAVHAYAQAIERVELVEIRDRLMEFRADHERHIRDLEICISQLGGTVGPRERDFKGFMIEGFTALRSMAGTTGALKAMQSNEEATNRHYHEALSRDLPETARGVVARNYEDERRHLAYVTRLLDEGKVDDSSVHSN